MSSSWLTIFGFFKEIALIIIGAFLVWIYNKFHKWFTLSRPVSKVLGTLASKEKIIIVIPKLYSTQNSLLKDALMPNQSILWNSNFALFAEGDSKVVMYLYKFLGLKKITDIEIKSDTELTGAEKDQELICIGAGSNDLTKNFQTTVRPRIEFGQQTTAGLQVFGFDIHDRHTNEVWTANNTDDYGLIIRWKNPRNAKTDIFILAGLGPVGTAAAGYYFSNNWKDIYDNLKMKNAFDKNFEVLIKTMQTDHTDIELIKIVIC